MQDPGCPHHGKTPEEGCKRSAKVRNEQATSLPVPCSDPAARRECHVCHEEHHGGAGSQQPARRAARRAHAPRAAAVTTRAPLLRGGRTRHYLPLQKPRRTALCLLASAAARQRCPWRGNCTVAIKEKQ